MHPNTEITIHSSNANDLVIITIRAETSLSNIQVCDILLGINKQLRGSSESRNTAESSGADPMETAVPAGSGDQA